jgi:hypothetical protein
VGFFFIGSGQESQKLFAAVAEGQPTVMNGTLNNRRHAFYHLISAS